MFVFDLNQVLVLPLVSVIKNDDVLLACTQRTLLLLRGIIVDELPLALVVHLEESLLHVVILLGVLVEYHFCHVPSALQYETIHLAVLVRGQADPPTRRVAPDLVEHLLLF